MKKLAKYKIPIDILMTLCLLACMAYLLIGEELHEWVGTGLFVLFVIHHMLNWRWFPGIFKGKYTPFRIIQTLVNVLMIFAMLGLFVSGMILSRYVFDFLPINGGTAMARTLHLICSYWGFVLMSFHLGLHWSAIAPKIKKTTGKDAKSKAVKWVARVLAIIAALYGGYAFSHHNLISYMFLKNQFVFFDMDRPLLLFFLDYIAMMVLWGWIAYYIKLFLLKRRKEKSL